MDQLARATCPAALAATLTAQNRNPLALDPLFERATIVESRGQQAAARAVLQEAVRLQPSNAADLGADGRPPFAPSTSRPRRCRSLAPRCSSIRNPSTQGILLTVLRAAAPPKPAKPGKRKPLTTPGD